MHKAHHSMLTSLLLVSGIAFLIGLVFDMAGWTVAIALFAWALFQVKQFSHLTHWLKTNNSDDIEPPEASGHWGEVFDELNRQLRRQQARERFLRDAISRFQQSSSAIPDAIVIIDQYHNLEWWNESANRLLGLNDLSDRGKPLMNMLRDPRFIRYYKRGNYDEPITLPSPVRNGIQLQLQIIPFGEADRLLAARDITRVMRLEQTRQDFVANASHELRTPLTVIRGYLETFLDQDLPAPLTRAMKSMELQSQRMENLVSDLLLLSRLEASQQISDEHPIKIQHVVQNIMDGAQQLASSKGHTFECDIDLQHDLSGQEIELHSAFSNLVYNAVRYTPENGQIRVRWWVDNEGGHFAVKDNGQGIGSIHLPRLTERFYRVDESRSSDSGGTGLGLAIVKHVLARHGGHLTIKSKVGKGSTFACHFPPELITQNHVDEDESPSN